jgi:hypothetical protein
VIKEKMGSNGVLVNIIASKCKTLGIGKMPINQLIYIGTIEDGTSTYIKVKSIYHEIIADNSYTNIHHQLLQFYPSGEIKYDYDLDIIMIYHDVGRTSLTRYSDFAYIFPLIGNQNAEDGTFVPAKRTDPNGKTYNTAIIATFEEIEYKYFKDIIPKEKEEIVYSMRRLIINKSHHYVLNYFDCSQFVGRSKETNESMFGNAIAYVPKRNIIQGGYHNYGYCYHEDIGYYYEDWKGVVDPNDNSQYDNGGDDNSCVDIHDAWYLPLYGYW